MKFVFVETAILCTKTTRRSYSEGQKLAAISAVNSGRSIREVRKAYKISESKFRLSMKTGITSSARLESEKTFTSEQEQEVVQHVLRLATLVFGITYTNFLKHALQCG
jgi:DNA-binding transcriptional regulator YiaG